MRAGKAATPEALAKKAAKERRAAERDRQAETKRRLQEYIQEHGGCRDMSAEQIEVRANIAAERRREQEARPTKVYPPALSTLNSLRHHSGPYADTAEQFAIALCVKGWACDSLARSGGATGHPSAVIQIAFDFYIAQLWRDLGTGRKGRPALCNLKPETRSELEEVVTDTLAEWKATGQPGPDIRHIWEAYRYMHGHIWSGELAAFPGCLPPPEELAGLNIFFTVNEGKQTVQAQ